MFSLSIPCYRLALSLLWPPSPSHAVGIYLTLALPFISLTPIHPLSPSLPLSLYLFPLLTLFIKVSDCSQVSDGGAAAVICSEEGLRKLGISVDDAVEVLAVGHATDNLYTQGNLTEMENTREAARRAYEGAGAKPEDIEVAET